MESDDRSTSKATEAADRCTISEFVARSGISRSRLKRWEEKLGLAVQRDERGMRYYTAADLPLYQRIAELRREGYSLALIRIQLAAAGAPVERVFAGVIEPVSVAPPTAEVEDLEQRRKQLMAEMQEVFRGAVKDITAGAVKETVDELLREQAAALETNLTGKLYERGEKLTESLVERFNSDDRNNRDIAIIARRQMEEKRRQYQEAEAAKPKRNKLQRAIAVILGKE